MWQRRKHFLALAFACFILYFPIFAYSKFIPAIDACLMINECKHTGISVCGQSTVSMKSRSFRDDCDMIEHNCYNQNDFVLTNESNCDDFNNNKLENLNNSETTTIKKDVTPDNIQNSTINDSISNKTTLITVTEDVKNITQVTLTTTDLPPTKVLIPTNSTSCGLATTSQNPIISNPVPPFFNIYVHIDSVKIDKQFEGLTTRETNSLSLTTTASTTSSSKAKTLITTTESSNTTNSNMTTEISSTNVTTVISNIVNNENASKETELTPTIVSTENTTINLENSTTAFPISNVTCKEYPKDCNVPLTWETTQKGETRDFLQILRERFGNSLKIMQGTTHFPKIFKISGENDLDSFVLGNHNES